MRNEGLIDEREIRKAIAQLKSYGSLFEVRVLRSDGKPLSGYFRDADALIKAFDTIDFRKANAYILLNTPMDAVGAREQYNKFLTAKSTTSDKEITGYDWLFIDMDPVRPTGISSTADELRKASELAQKIYVYLSGLGFEEPIKAFSGNGYHLLYSIALANNDANKMLVEKCLKALSNIFSDEYIKVDTANYNPARICKLYGTMAQKGADTENRPHRMARIDGDIKKVKVTEKSILEKLASEIPDDMPKPEAYNNYSPSGFDMISFLDEHGIRYKEQTGSDCTIYRLDECPFDSNHRNGDSKIFHYKNGAIAFKCHHDSCQGKKWQDVRTLFEPDAYSKAYDSFDKAIEEGWARHNRYLKAIYKNDAIGERWETVSDILKKPAPDSEYIKTRITDIDVKMHGLLKGGISVWSGLRASAKSTILSQIALHAVNDKHTVMFYSGELTGKRFTRWIVQQAAGRQYVKEYEKDGSTFCVVPDDIQRKVAKWIGQHIYIYNNDYGSDYDELIASIKSQISIVKPDLIVLDNLMTIDISDIDRNENTAQTVLMKTLKDIANHFNVHIALVAHPRKSIRFLRLYDIAGSGNIANMVDSAFIVHRYNHDFVQGYKEEYGLKTDDDVAIEFMGCTNIIEIAKDREEGIQDTFVKLWYDGKTRQLKNNRNDVIKFAWNEEWNEELASGGFMETTENPFEEVHDDR